MLASKVVCLVVMFYKIQALNQLKKVALKVCSCFDQDNVATVMSSQLRPVGRYVVKPPMTHPHRLLGQLTQGLKELTVHHKTSQTQVRYRLYTLSWLSCGIGVLSR